MASVVFQAKDEILRSAELRKWRVSCVGPLFWIYIYLRRGLKWKFGGTSRVFLRLNATSSFQLPAGKCTLSLAPFVWQLRNVFQSSFILSAQPKAHGAAWLWQPSCVERILLLRSNKWFKAGFSVEFRLLGRPWRPRQPCLFLQIIIFCSSTLTFPDNYSSSALFVSFHLPVRASQAS